MQKQYKKGELTKQILSLFLVGGLVVVCATFPGTAYLIQAIGATNTREKKRIQQAVRRMEQQGLLVRKVQNGKEILELTPKGGQQLETYLVEDLTIQRQKKWDKKWRVVMFDIPETKVRVRREISFKIKDIGMKAIQNSVFISPFPCKKELDLIANHYNVKKYFIYLETDTIESTHNLLSSFSLRKY